MPEPVIYTPLGTDLSPPVTFTQYRINDKTWRGCRDRTPPYGLQPTEQIADKSDNPLAEHRHLCTRVLRDYTNTHTLLPSPHVRRFDEHREGFIQACFMND